MRKRIERAAEKVREADPQAESYRAMIANSGADWGGGVASHLISMVVYLPKPDEQGFSASQFAAKWRKQIGNIPELENIEYFYTTGPSGGDDISVGFEHNDHRVLREAADKLVAALETRAGVQGIYAGIGDGKMTWEITPTEQARQEGLTETTLGSAIRSAVYGVEALRQQQGRRKVRTFVKLKTDGSEESKLDELICRSSGKVLPLKLAADYRERLSDTIRRQEGSALFMCEQT